MTTRVERALFYGLLIWCFLGIYLLIAGLGKPDSETLMGDMLAEYDSVKTEQYIDVLRAVDSVRARNDSLTAVALIGLFTEVETLKKGK